MRVTDVGTWLVSVNCNLFLRGRKPRHWSSARIVIIPYLSHLCSGILTIGWPTANNQHSREVKLGHWHVFLRSLYLLHRQAVQEIRWAEVYNTEIMIAWGSTWNNRVVYICVNFPPVSIKSHKKQSSEINPCNHFKDSVASRRCISVYCTQLFPLHLTSSVGFHRKQFRFCI